MSQTARFSTGRAQAFTLIELMVAMAIGTLVILSALSVLNSLSQQWVVNAGMVQGRAEARLALDLLRRDIEAGLRAAPETWLLIRPATMATGGDPASTELYVLSTSLDRADPAVGDVWGVAYGPSLADPFQTGGPDARRGLYRLSVKPPDVFIGGIETKTGDWWNDFWQPRRSGLDAPPNLLATAAVFRCEATVVDRRTNTLQHVPPDRIVRVGATGVTVDPQLGTAQASDLRLAAIDVTLVVLRPQGAVLLQSRKALTAEQWRRLGDTFSEHILF